jgi:putative membrane protein
MPRPIQKKLALLRKTFCYVGWSLCWLLVWDVAVTADTMLLLDDPVDMPLTPLTLLCSALVVLISFRNTSAYNRWWEARTLWGAMVNSSRSFGRQVLTLIDDTGAGRNRVKLVLLFRHMAYINALRAHLKGTSCAEAAAPYLAKHELLMAEGNSNFPNDILNGTAQLLAKEFSQGRLDSIRLARIESTLVDMSNCQGGMERINNTPLPYPYIYFPRLFTTLFCIIMPMGLVSTLGWFTPVVSTVVGFILLALERIGTELQAPFADSQHQITMDSLCVTIEKNLRSMAQENIEQSAEADLTDVIQSLRIKESDQEMPMDTEVSVLRSIAHR